MDPPPRASPHTFHSKSIPDGGCSIKADWLRHHRIPGRWEPLSLSVDVLQTAWFMAQGARFYFCPDIWEIVGWVGMGSPPPPTVGLWATDAQPFERASVVSGRGGGPPFVGGDCGV